MKQQGFASKFGTLMVLAGSAVGLGNIWKFPYMLGNNGGAAFLVVYLGFVFLLGIPLMVAELAIGRAVQKNAIDAFGNGPFRCFGVLGVITITTILCFYSTIGGWAIAYTYYYATGAMSALGSQGIQSFFVNLTTHPYEPLMWQFVFMFLTGLFLAGGVQKGLEKASKIMMPILFFGLIALAIRSLTLEGAMKGLTFMFNPDFSKIDGSVLLAAMGQAFFSLSLGSAIMVTYGAYLDKKESLFALSTKVAISDTFIAVIAGIVIFPAVFVFGLDVNAGPSLLFITLPHVFEAMPFGQLWGFFFFVLVLFAALTSSISMLETSVSYFVTNKNYKRTPTVVVLASLVFGIGIFMTLSQGILSDFLIFGKNILDFFDDITTKIMIPFTAFGCAIYAGWVMKKETFIQEMLSPFEKVTPFYTTLLFLIKFVLPILVGIILLQGVRILFF